MKLSLLSALTTFTILGMSQQVKAYNLEACVKDPMISKPETINLLQPIDQKMMNCIPELDSIAGQWQAKANGILSSIKGVQIGNQGKSALEKLEYNVTGNTISLVAKVQAKHTWSTTIPAVRGLVPVDKWRWVDVEYPDIRWHNKCRYGICVPWGEPFMNSRREKMFYVVKEMRTITQKRVVSGTASTTCTYDYTFNLSTLEQKPVFNCGQGSLGNYKLDASAITRILNGEMPTLGKLIASVNITPPMFKDANRDSYNDERNKVIAAHSDSLVYFSSQSFVEWASAENHGANIAAALISGGSYAPELLRQIEERLVTELEFLGAWTTQTGVNLGADQLVSMLTTGEVIKLNGFSISVKAIDVPYIYQKCIVGGDCTPEAKSPRLGFAIIATRSEGEAQMNLFQSGFRVFSFHHLVARTLDFIFKRK